MLISNSEALALVQESVDDTRPGWKAQLDVELESPPAVHVTLAPPIPSAPGELRYTGSCSYLVMRATREIIQLGDFDLMVAGCDVLREAGIFPPPGPEWDAAVRERWPAVLTRALDVKAGKVDVAGALKGFSS